MNGSIHEAKTTWIIIFLFPTLIAYGLFILWPLIASAYYSFFQWNGFGNRPTYFIGLRNYLDALKDPFFWNAFKNTLIFVIGNNIIKLPLTLIMAFLLNIPRFKMSNFYRVVLFLPVVSSTAIIGIIFTFLLSPWNGPLNALFIQFGLLKAPVDWLGTAGSAMWMVMLVEIWHYTGQYIIYWIAGLQSIPDVLYEAAAIDGASRFKMFIHITLPVLKPVIVVVSLIGFVMSLRVFDIVISMTGGGPAFGTDVIGTYIYHSAFGVADRRIGYASAISVLFGIIVMSLGILQGIAMNKAKRRV